MEPVLAKPEKLEPEWEPQSLVELNERMAAEQPYVTGGKRAVLGEGPIGAPIAFVGEQPGDREDQEGRPFVGPAGRVLDKAMAVANIERERCYVTNAVKHFKHQERGKRRLHQKPTAGEVRHYRWWLLKEIDLVSPRLVVALGATAALALAGRPFSILRHRGEAYLGGRYGFVTVHPSYLLRLRGEAERAQAFAAFVGDLRQVELLSRASS